MKKERSLFLFFFFLFLLSRLLLLGKFPHFYDSPEYLRESFSPNFVDSIRHSHQSIHPLYLFLIQKSQQLFGPAVWSASLVSLVFGVFSFVFFFLLGKRLFGHRVALFSLLPIAFFPHLALLQTQIMHESVDFAFFLAGLFFFTVFFDQKKYLLLIVAIGCFSLAIFDYPGMVLWLPVLFGLAIFSAKKERKQAVLTATLVSFLAISLALLGLFFILRQAFGPEEKLTQLFFQQGGLLTQLLSPVEVLRTLRNGVWVIFYGYFAGAIALLLLSRTQNQQFFLFFLCWLFPFFLNLSFWHGGLYGRLGGLIGYPLGWAIALSPKKRYSLLSVIVIFTFFPTFSAFQKQPVAEIQKQIIEKAPLGENDLLVLSDYQRPQMEYLLTKAVYVGNETKTVEALINQKLEEGKRVFLSEQAVAFPYWQYDGQKIHILSRGNAKKAHLTDFLEGRKLEKVAGEEKYPLLTIWELR